jgi:hypothetical protein
VKLHWVPTYIFGYTSKCPLNLGLNFEESFTPGKNQTRNLLVLQVKAGALLSKVEFYHCGLSQD